MNRSTDAARIAFLGMLVATAAVYVRPAALARGESLVGLDYEQLHARRIGFAREWLFRSSPSLPAWYAKEALGTPFASNPQSFPWTPGRLLLLPVGPTEEYLVGVLLAALASAAFTFAFCRRIGLDPLPAAVGGWTFACSGYFASRVLAGHLPLLEAYAGLPLLLWLVERALTPAPPQPRDLVALGLATFALVLCGHPQLPLYGIGAALIYALARARSRAWFRVAGAMGSGVLATGFAWVPALLLIRRSSRLLSLAPAENDIALPHQRLLAWIDPWRDGWPAIVRQPVEPLRHLANDAVFWDTVNYVGILPLCALAVLGTALLWRRGHVPRGVGVLMALGTLALVFALPWAHPPGAFTLLRSPARLTYVTTFLLAVVCGLGFQWLGTALTRPWLRRSLLAAGLLVHGMDLGMHSVAFVHFRERGAWDAPTILATLESDAGQHRVAIDYNLPLPFNRRFDDVGFLDSLVLARPYRALLEMSGAPPSLNREALKGSWLPARLLENLGVRFVVTRGVRSDLARKQEENGVTLYELDHPVARALLFPDERIWTLDAEGISARLRSPSVDLASSIALEGAPSGPIDPSGPPATVVPWSRPSPDDLDVDVRGTQGGFLRLSEAWDPGWSVTVDGTRGEAVPAEGFLLGVRIPASSHGVHFRYSTPGRGAGGVVSFAGLLALLALARNARISGVTSTA